MFIHILVPSRNTTLHRLIASQLTQLIGPRYTSTSIHARETGTRGHIGQPASGQCTRFVSAACAIFPNVSIYKYLCIWRHEEFHANCRRCRVRVDIPVRYFLNGAWRGCCPGHGIFSFSIFPRIFISELMRIRWLTITESVILQDRGEPVADSGWSKIFGGNVVFYCVRIPVFVWVLCLKKNEITDVFYKIVFYYSWE